MSFKPPGTWARPAKVEETDIRTTLILKNLPPCYTRDMVVDLLHSQGFQDTLDFAYVPMKIWSMPPSAIGYAIINLTDNDAAHICTKTLQGFTLRAGEVEQVLEVDWSEMHQGFTGCVERCRNSTVMHTSVGDEFKPAIF